MDFQVEPATYSDLDALAEVMVSAHVKDELIPTMMRRVPHDVQVKWYADAFRNVWDDSWVHYYKATEVASRKIVAMARFHYPRSMTVEEKARGESNPFGPLPVGSNVELCQEFFDKLEHYETRYIDREKTYFVNFLATLPDYHRKSLGTRLIEVCLKDAYKADSTAFLIATPAGSGLYRKLGFKEIDRVSWDTVPHGGDGIVTWLCMTRDPNLLDINGRATCV